MQTWVNPLFERNYNNNNMYLFDALPLQKLNLLIVADRGITHVEEQLLTTNPF